MKTSDLKNLYLSRQELNSKYVAPIVTQAELFKNVYQQLIYINN